jgi:hypothetical protein
MKHADQVLMVLANAGAPMRIDAIRQQTGHTVQQDNNARYELRKNGLAERDTDLVDGLKYRITEAGSKQALKLAAVSEVPDQLAAKKPRAASLESTIVDPVEAFEEDAEISDFDCAYWASGVLVIQKAGQVIQLESDDVRKFIGYLGVISLVRPAIPPCPPAPFESARDGSAPANKFGHLFATPPGPAPTEPIGLVSPGSTV